MHEDRIIGARLGKRVGHVALLVALAVVPVLALNSLATADTGTTAGSRPGITDAQRQCLANQGVSLPTRSSDGDKPSLTRDQRLKLRAAGQACGLGHGTGRSLGRARGLTDEPWQCLADHGVSPPARSTDGTRPAVSAEQRAALRQAAETCGLPAGRDVGGDGTV